MSLPRRTVRRRFGDGARLGAWTLLALVMITTLAGAESRIPPPDFETDYELPTPTTPHDPIDLREYITLGVLVVALSVGAWLALRRRSRLAIFVLMVICLVWFGFVRKGCVCSIGSIQNVALGVFGDYTIPLVVLGFFVLPLVAALLFGRVFCGSACPLGAIQDLVALRPVRVPAWLESSLRLLAYAYLAVGVLLASTGTAFVVCRYDPFVGLFRFDGRVEMLIAGGLLLLIGVFVARPYCRFLCPYGVLLSWASRLSWKRVTITPDECVQCRLCEDACPFGAIRKPNADALPRPRHEGKLVLGVLIVATPLLIIAGTLVGRHVAPALSRVDTRIQLADRVALEDAGEVEGRTDASTAFRASGRSVEQLRTEAADVEKRFRVGGAVVGAFLAMVVAGKLISLTLRRRRTDYEADRGACLACGRCFSYCPIERKRRADRSDGGAA
jgi:NosR/NirI family transcriptional regulator, nitrous oxide reductase regulator